MRWLSTVLISAFAVVVWVWWARSLVGLSEGVRNVGSGVVGPGGSGSPRTDSVAHGAPQYKPLTTAPFVSPTLKYLVTGGLA